MAASSTTRGKHHWHEPLVSRYDTLSVDIYQSARKHGISDDDIEHAENAMVAADDDDDDDDDGKVLYLGADRAGNLLEVICVERDDGTEVVIHAMRMRRIYEPLLGAMGDADD